MSQIKRNIGGAGEVRRDRRADCGGTWYRDSEDAFEVRGRRIAPFGAAVKWSQSLPPEEREVAIKEMQDEVELTGDIDGEFFPDHECPWDTAMWRDAFGRE